MGRTEPCLSDPIPSPPTHALPEPTVEYGVEITWVDPRKAGAVDRDGNVLPPRVYGFDTPEQTLAFREAQLRDREVAAVRVMVRLAAYTECDRRASHAGGH